MNHNLPDIEREMEIKVLYIHARHIVHSWNYRFDKNQSDKKRDEFL